MRWMHYCLTKECLLLLHHCTHLLNCSTGVACCESILLPWLQICKWALSRLNFYHSKVDWVAAKILKEAHQKCLVLQCGQNNSCCFYIITALLIRFTYYAAFCKHGCLYCGFGLGFRTATGENFLPVVNSTASQGKLKFYSSCPFCFPFPPS